ncbi:MAG: hypothetical protein ABSB15_02100 [Bryobacteraceae bacterium]|jgi:hypothetical protein
MAPFPGLRRGTILVRADIRLPASLSSSETELLGEWNLLSLCPSETFFERLKVAGWKCFYIGGEINLTATGRTYGGTMAKLLNRVQRVVKKRDCNCIEITGMETSRSLGFSNVRLGAQARHVQKGSEGTVALGLVQD